MKKTSKPVASKAGHLLGGADEIIAGNEETEKTLCAVNRDISDFRANLQLMDSAAYGLQEKLSFMISHVRRITVELQDVKSIAGHELNEAKGKH